MSISVIAIMNILNANRRASRYSSKSVDLFVVLQEHIRKIFQTFYDENSKTFNFSQFAHSEEFQTYQLILGSAHQLDLSKLKTDEQKIRFWLNIYNILSIHLVIKLSIKNSIEEHRGFFSQYGYSINDKNFSLDDIEHGILRANSKPYSSIQKPFKTNDLRLPLACRSINPRIHFGLYYACTSSPELMYFDEIGTEEQLINKTKDYLAKNIRVDLNSGTISLPKTFKWYEQDFGSKEDIINFIRTHTTNELLQKNLIANKNKFSIEYLNFDWEIKTA